LFFDFSIFIKSHPVGFVLCSKQHAVNGESVLVTETGHLVQHHEWWHDIQLNQLLTDYWQTRNVGRKCKLINVVYFFTDYWQTRNVGRKCKLINVVYFFRDYCQTRNVGGKINYSLLCIACAYLKQVQTFQMKVIDKSL